MRGDEASPPGGTVKVRRISPPKREEEKAWPAHPDPAMIASPKLPVSLLPLDRHLFRAMMRCGALAAGSPPSHRRQKLVDVVVARHGATAYGRGGGARACPGSGQETLLFPAVSWSILTVG